GRVVKPEGEAGDFDLPGPSRVQPVLEGPGRAIRVLDRATDRFDLERLVQVYRVGEGPAGRRPNHLRIGERPQGERDGLPDAYLPGRDTGFHLEEAPAGTAKIPGPVQHGDRVGVALFEVALGNKPPSLEQQGDQPQAPRDD